VSGFNLGNIDSKDLVRIYLQDVSGKFRSNSSTGTEPEALLSAEEISKGS
jgi:hypothetical protein